MESTVEAVTVVDLAPGQTSAQLAWEPSQGSVESYFVFETRNGGGYSFKKQTSKPATKITGKPGDRVQILVTAVGEDGSTSPASAPSPEIRFYAADIPETTKPVAVTAIVDTPAAVQTSPESDVETTSSTELQDTVDEVETSPEEASPITTALHDQLIASHARLPAAGIGADADRWLRTHVDDPLQAGVELVGTGHPGTGDGAAEADLTLVWRDAAGQLFVSDAGEILSADQPAEQLVEALRLGATERFVAYEDFDSDGVADWLIEDSATSAIWLVGGQDGLAQAVARPSLQALDPWTSAEEEAPWLLGHSDLDGDGALELLWIAEDGSVLCSDPRAEIEPARLTEASTLEILTIDDFDGDGRDDLLAIDPVGDRLAIAGSSLAADPFVRDWAAGPDATLDGRELVASLDLDGDGAAELAWVEGETLEIWDAQTGPTLD